MYIETVKKNAIKEIKVLASQASSLLCAYYSLDILIFPSEYLHMELCKFQTFFVLFCRFFN